MQKLGRYILLALLLLLVRYAISVIAVNSFPTYTITSDARILNESVSLSKDAPRFELAQIWNKGLAVRYVDIALNGYSSVSVEDASTTNWSLYPLYPLALGFANDFVPFLDDINLVYVLGVLLSALFLGIGLFYLDKLLEMLWLFDDKKYFVFLLLLTFPGSFYFSLVYADALLFMLAVLSFYLLFNKRYFWTSLIIGLSALASPSGLLLIVPLLVYYFLIERYNKRVSMFPKAVTYTVIAVLPLLPFYYHLFAQTGDLFAAFRAHASGVDFMPIPFWYFVDLLSGGEFMIQNLVSAALLLSALVLVAFSFVKLFIVFEFRPPEHMALFVYSIVFVLFLSGFSAATSMLRLLSVAFPLFILPALVTNTFVRTNSYLGLLFVFLSFQVLAFVAYLVGISF